MNKSGVELISEDKIIWWIQCYYCKEFRYGIDKRNAWLNSDPICLNKKCKKYKSMIMGLTNPYWI
jgi:hypothetical protein